MPMKIRLIATAVLLILATTASAQDKGKTKKLYCWEEKGQKVCGDALPAEAAGSARSEFSAKSGRRVGEVARALTGEERTAAEIAAKQAVVDAEAEAMRKRREHAIAESYATEADLRRAFQERIDLLDATLKASNLGVTALRQSLLGLLRQAGELELGGKPVPPTTANNIVVQHTELRRRERILAQQRLDRAELDNELNRVLERYRAMKQPVGVVAPAPAPSEPMQAPSGG